jgi:hypothetical protein
MCKELPTDFSLSVNCWKIFRDNIVVTKEQGAHAEIRRKSWLKQLRVAVSTKASLPIGSNKFCRLAQRRLKFSKTNEDFS